jgi:biotin operon repressor
MPYSRRYPIDALPAHLAPPLVLRPGTKVVDHEAPKHRCPICWHTCATSPALKDGGGRMGRPPLERAKFLAYIRRYGSEANPLAMEEIRAQFHYPRKSVITMIHRLRREDGVDIRCDARGRYWLPIDSAIPPRLNLAE